MVGEKGSAKDKRGKNRNIVQDEKGQWVQKREWLKGSRFDSRLYVAPDSDKGV